MKLLKKRRELEARVEELEEIVIQVERELRIFKTDFRFHVHDFSANGRRYTTEASKINAGF